MMKIKRNSGESYLSFVERATSALSDGLIDYQEWSIAVVGEDLYSDETTRRIAKFFSQFIQNLENDELNGLDGDREQKAKKAIEELKAERIKLQTENLQYNANARAEARNELYYEKIIDAINRLEPVKVKDINFTPSIGTTGLLCLSDFHAGSTFKVKGMYNEVVNEYSFEIMESRLWRLLGMIGADDIDVENMVVAILGDCFEGILRTSSLTKLREPVIDTVIRFSEFMSIWLIELYNTINVPIKVVTVGGNHDNCRFLSSQPQFEDENLTKLVVEFLKLRLKDVPEIVIDDYTDVAIKTIRGTNVMFTHGYEKDLTATIEYFSNLYAIDCDEIYAGHLHSFEAKTIGIADVGNRMVYRVGSICGCDPYAKKVMKSARPSAYLAEYTDDGHGWSKDYYL